MRESFQNERDRVITLEVLVDKLTDTQKLTTTVIEKISLEVKDNQIKQLEKLDEIKTIICGKIDGLKTDFNDHCVEAIKDCNKCKELNNNKLSTLVPWKVYTISLAIMFGVLGAQWMWIVDKLGG